MVGGGLFLSRGECGCELLEELEQGLAKAAVGFKKYWRDGVRVVFVTFVEFSKGVGVARSHRDVRGTRQGSCCCGGGDHYVEVDGGVGCVEGDVGSVELVAVLIWVCGVIRICYEDLFDERSVSSDTVYQVDQVITQVVVSAVAVGTVLTR